MSKDLIHISDDTSGIEKCKPFDFFHLLQMSQNKPPLSQFSTEIPNYIISVVYRTAQLYLLSGTVLMASRQLSVPAQWSSAYNFQAVSCTCLVVLCIQLPGSQLYLLSGPVPITSRQSALPAQRYSAYYLQAVSCTCLVVLCLYLPGSQLYLLSGTVPIPSRQSAVPAQWFSSYSFYAVSCTCLVVLCL